MNLLLCLTLSTALPAQSPTRGDIAIEKFLADETAKVSKNFLGGAKTREDWEKARPRLQRQYFDMLGLIDPTEKTPLNAKVTGTLTRGEVVVENLHFQSRPGLYVTGNLYRPKATPKKKSPAILYLCGHTGRERDGNKTAFQDHGMWFARNGYVCLLIDTLQLGEIAGTHHGTYNLNRWWWHSRGYTPAGVECWNGVRAIDYLVSRPEVDADKIGVTGISGGGAATIWIAAADPRVKVAVPVSGMSDLESYVKNKVINGHCDCMFLYNTHRWEWTTMAALIAPRPMLFANSDNDGIFPMDGNRRIMARLREVYKLLDKPELVEEYVSKGGHDYRPDLRLAIFRFFDKHLMGVKRKIEDADDEPLPGARLRAFPKDADIPKDAINGKVDETFSAIEGKNLVEENRYRFLSMMLLGEEWRIRYLGVASASRYVLLASAPKLVEKVPGGAIYSTEGHAIAFLSEPVAEGKRGGTEGTLIVLADDDKDGVIPEWAKDYVGEGEVRLVRPRGTGPTRWTRRNPPNYVERAHVLLGRTVDAGRIFDIARFAKVQTERKDRANWTIIGRGASGILGAYAALVVPRVKRVVVIDPPRSHREGPHLLGVQQYFDIPDGLGLLAPRPLVLVGAKDKAFDTTSVIYRRIEAADKLTRK
jgi:dienelactone hydrolase